jgi:hypothetical protein
MERKVARSMGERSEEEKERHREEIARAEAELEAVQIRKKMLTLQSRKLVTEVQIAKRRREEVKLLCCLLCVSELRAYTGSTAEREPQCTRECAGAGERVRSAGSPCADPLCCLRRSGVYACRPWRSAGRRKKT